MSKFSKGDRIVAYGRVGTVVSKDGEAVYSVRYDNGRGMTERVYESDMTITEDAEPARLWRYDPDSVNEWVESDLTLADFELPEKDPYSTGAGEEIDQITASLLRERLRYHAAHQAMENFREERDFLLEKIHEATTYLDRCAARDILEEALARNYTNGSSAPK